ncbi:MAG: hypothetical protein M3458_01540 [Acidobacteriota bacterium]|nr:hypothetical protein [Acidobacteriota bacterium]
MKIIKISLPEPAARQPFENFERLAKDLMAVPKKELDEKIAEYERDKKRRKRKKKT